MLENLATLHKFQLRYIQLLAEDFGDADLGVAPFPGANPPVWILGHLAVCTDYAAGLLGQKPACPRTWHKLFAPGSDPAAVPSPYPTKAELLAAIEHGHQRCAAALAEVDLETLNQPHSIELLKPTVLKTNADVLCHLMSTHEAFHVAQLSACRRQQGKPPIV